MDDPGFLDDDKLILADFSATWCSPCQTMIPVMEDIKKKMNHLVHIVEVDVDENFPAAAAFKIISVPTFILFRKGKEVWRKSGLITRKEFEEVINKHHPTDGDMSEP